jgi:hypothetical protein
MTKSSKLSLSFGFSYQSSVVYFSPFSWVRIFP